MASMASVQELLKAEQEARSIVEGARADKSQSLKAARREAEEEIQRYRVKVEAEHERLISRDAESGKSDFAKLKQETDVNLGTIQGQLERNQGKVVTMLLEAVTTV
eukprot:CAMPEP_0201481926 /NCGR_PEP_ID=MMETSP0151_2-20130828/6180_1 /ASSEMBLY_ACC=CAM_ASM_000257 /TAXON_ID=200890 /ORGANISM="Paramoeba atlantica, Strain 621/1 / CCAP 1560/9" /LENGTH=105 /DNA_ID=CAMNT_0047864339 /DNA_START=99 /DNA_END=416 /DNA_ORIENTATION=+